METIFWISVTLFVIALISVIMIIRKHNKLYENKANENGHMEFDGLSERYMQVLDCEQPFVDYY